jgi:hypothetical protein
MVDLDFGALDALDEETSKKDEFKRERTNQLSKRLVSKEPPAEEKKTAGRPATGQVRKTISFSFDEELIARIQKFCKENYINKSSLGEDLFRAFLDKKQ